MSLSDAAAQRTKKQFKSQSVNSLFRQQATNLSDTTQDQHHHPGLIKKKSSGTTTKLKLVSKKANTVNRSRLEKKKTTAKETSPPVWNRSESPERKETSLSSTTTLVVATDINDQVSEAKNDEGAKRIQATLQEAEPQESTQFTKTPNALTPQVENFNWADDDEDNIWLDLQNQIHNETKPPLHKPSLWSTSSPKISSFRKNTPTISSLNQSPLINSASDIFDEPTDLFTLQSRQSSNDSRYKAPPPNFTEENLWNQTFNLWNIEDRQLSTKSDSTLLWSPFNNKKRDMDDPLKSIGLDSQIRHATSRFFPSPSVEQESTFFNSPAIKFTPERKPNITRSKSIDDSISDIIKLINTEKKYPDYLETSTLKSEQELFTDHFNSDPKSVDIAISFPGSYTIQQESPLVSSSRQSYTQEQYYPEGFASTFYKRGINNFMFVRELQPKLITSKAKDTVEVRISLPSINTDLQSEEDVFFKMRCYIINVGLRELNGKNNGYKLSQKSNNNHGNNNHYQHNGYGRARYGNATYSKNGYSRRN